MHSVLSFESSSRENSIVVTNPFNWIKEMRTEDKPGDKLGDKPGDKLGDKNRKEVLPKVITTKEKVYVAILNNPNITKPEIAALLRIGKTTVDNYITELKKDGKIRRVGSNKTGYWEVL